MESDNGHKPVHGNRTKFLEDGHRMIAARNRSLVENYEHICKSDSAVNRDVEDFENVWRQYIEGAVEPPLHPGATPTVFTLKHITGKSKAMLSREVKRFRADDTDVLTLGSAIAAFRLSVVGVEPFADDAGKTVKLTFENVDGVRALSEDSTMQFDEDIVAEVGFRAQMRTYLDPK